MTTWLLEYGFPGVGQPPGKARDVKTRRIQALKRPAGTGELVRPRPAAPAGDPGRRPRPWAPQPTRQHHPVHRVAGPGQPGGRGSEVLVDQLACGVAARGHRVTLLCGGPVAERPYHVMRNGGSYSQFARAPLAYLRSFRDADLIVEVCNGMPFLAPLWSRRPVICSVNHVHTELWPITLPPAGLDGGPDIESTVMPWVHRKNLFLTVSPSTAEALERMGVGPDRIRQICNGVVQPDPLTARSPDPLFLALAGSHRLQAPRSAAAAVGSGAARGRREAGDRRGRAGARAAGGTSRAGRGVHRAGVGAGETPAAVLGVAADAPGADRRLGHRGIGGGDPRYPRGRLRRAGAA